MASTATITQTSASGGRLELTGMPVTLGKDYDIHTVVRSGRLPLEYRQATQQVERTSQPIGPPAFAPVRARMPLETLLRKHLRFAGNPAVMALALDRWLCVPVFRRVCPLATLENMPNKSRLHKRSNLKLTARSPQSLSKRGVSGSGSQSPHSVKDLLARSVPVLSQAANHNARQAFWRPWLEAHLPPELAPQITAITERDRTLVVFATSPAWSARLRYALQELASSNPRGPAGHRAGNRPRHAAKTRQIAVFTTGAVAVKGFSGSLKNRGSAHAPSGICQDGKSPAFRAKQDSESAESFSGSLQGSIHGVPGKALTVAAPEPVRNSVSASARARPRQSRRLDIRNWRIRIRLERHLLPGTDIRQQPPQQPIVSACPDLCPLNSPIKLCPRR